MQYERRPNPLGAEARYFFFFNTMVASFSVDALSETNWLTMSHMRRALAIEIAPFELSIIHKQRKRV